VFPPTWFPPCSRCIRHSHCAHPPSFNLTGTKIFISGGEHDLTSNIVHIVLARLPGAPAGTKGISLFLVPKHLENADGTLEEKKNVVCAGIENKMGIKSSSTAVLAFEDSKGWLIGKENDGLNHMFTFMNTARLGTALQGVCHMERAYQGALPWAMERASMRALSGKKYPEDAADKIIVHGDVRKMLLTIKAMTEGGRCMMYDAAMLADSLLDEDVKKRDECESHLGLHTPTMKAFLTEIGQECTSLGMQIYGGAGFIKDYGMEQIHRDALISTKYEGTTGVQALDLLGRKIILDKGNEMKTQMKKQISMCWDIGTGAEAGNHGIRGYAFQIAKLTGKWGLLTAQILKGAASDKDTVATASVDFLMYTGYMSVGYQWLRMMNSASAALSSDPDMAEADRIFYESKLNTGKFYFERLLPRADSHATMCVKSPDSIMDMHIDGWDMATTLPSDSGQAYGKNFVS